MPNHFEKASFELLAKRQLAMLGAVGQAPMAPIPSGSGIALAGNW